MADPKVTWRIGIDDRITRSLKDIDGRISGISKGFRTLAGFAGFATLTASFYALARQSVELAGGLQDASEKFGVSSGFLQRIGQVASEAGADLGSVEVAFRQLAKTSEAAIAGNNEAVASFAALGLSASKLEGVSLDRKFLAVAKALSAVADPSERVALAVKLLGRSATDLIPIMADLEAKMAGVNIVAGDEQVEAVDAAADAWERFKGAALRGTIGLLGETVLAFERATKARDDFVSRPEYEGRKPKLLPLPDRTPGGTSRRFPGQAREFKDAEAGLASLRAATAALDAFVVSQDAAKAALKDATADMARILADTATPLESYAAGLERVRELQASYGLSAETAAREMQRLGEVLGAETQAAVDATAAGRAWNDDLAAQARILKDIKTPFDNYVESLREIQRLNAGGLLSDDEAILAKAKALDDLAASADQAGSKVSATSDRILTDIKNATQGFARDITDIFFDTTQSIGDMFADLAEEIARIFIQQSVIQPILDALLGGFGGTVSPIDTSKFPQRRATGGPVISGQPYIVGERGPELFVPRESGAIVTNRVLERVAESFRSTARPQHRATGGPVSRDQPYIVGERGPELFVPGEPGTIITNKSLERVAETFRSTVGAVDRSAAPPRQPSGGPVFGAHPYLAGERGLPGTPGAVITNKVLERVAETFRSTARPPDAPRVPRLPGIIITNKTRERVAETFHNTAGPVETVMVSRLPATDGTVSAGQPYLVGEHGPALFVPGAPATRVTNKVLERLAERVSVAARLPDAPGAPGAPQRQLVVGPAFNPPLVGEHGPALAVPAGHPGAVITNKVLERAVGRFSTPARPVATARLPQQPTGGALVAPMGGWLVSPVNTPLLPQRRPGGAVVSGDYPYLVGRHGTELFVPPGPGIVIANKAMDLVAGRFGGSPQRRAEGGPVAGGRLYIVGERGPELFIPGEPGAIVTNTVLERVAERFGGLVSQVERSRLPQHRAGGGSVFGGHPYIVGERGPELFVPRGAGTVVSNNAMAASDMTNITFNVTSLDPRKAAAVIAENEKTIVNVIRKAQYRSGRRPTL